MTSVISLIIFTSIMDFDKEQQNKRNHTIGKDLFLKCFFLNIRLLYFLKADVYFVISYHKLYL